MHILHLEAGRHLYGGARQVLLLLEGLRARGVKVTLACPAGSAIAAAAGQAGLPVLTHELGGDLDVTAVTFLLRAVGQMRPDLLHVHSRRGADFFGAIAARLAGVPAVLTRRVDNPGLPGLSGLMYQSYARIVAISGAVRAQLAAEGVPDAKLTVIRSAVDLEACAPVWSREQFLHEFGLAPGQPVVGMVAQFIPRKGHEALLEAWPRVTARYSGARLLLLGRGPLEADLRARFGDRADVHFAGFRPDLPAFLGHLDLLVHPALAEGLGLSLLEAQGAGVPVVGFAAGGVPEAVADGVAGLLAPAGDMDGLVERLVRLLTDPGLRQRMGTAGRTRVRREFAPAVMVERYLALYRSLLPAGAPDQPP